jgi:hypothetical protein
MNSFNYSFDKEDNITVAYSKQNRIEKYSADGELLWKTDRKLPYEMSNPEEPTISIQRSDGGGEGGGVGGIVSFRAIGSGSGNSTNTFARSIAVDDQERNWVLSVLKQATGSEDEGDFEPAEEVLEIYDEEGILLSRFPMPELETILSFKIFGERLFFIDRTTEMAVYEYLIVEK